MNFLKNLHKYKKRKTIFMILAIGFSLSFLPIVSGYILPKTNFEMYIENDLILLGQVTTFEDVTEEFNWVPSTSYKFSILQNVKGTTSEIEITAIGLGSINATNQIDNQTIFSEGEKVLLILNRQEEGHWSISPYSSPADSEFLDSKFILSPLKLSKAGISPSDIHCKSDLKLAIKSTDNSPICLTPETFEKLSERRWIK